MKPVITKESAALLDQYCSDELGIPSLILMENAAIRTANIAIKYIKKLKLSRRIAIFCGGGNNGGDGFAIARHLNALCDVAVYFLGSTDRMSEAAKINYDAAIKLNIPVVNISQDLNYNYNFQEADVIIDALIGVGGSGALRDETRALTRLINRSDALKIAVDSPTGLDCDTGEADADCVRADVAVTMFAIKRGMLIGEGPDVCGRIFTETLTSPQSAPTRFTNDYYLELTDVARILPTRKRSTSKFDYGRVCAFAGSAEMPGAGALVSNAAIKAGSGLVYLFSSGLSNALKPEIIPTKLNLESDNALIDLAWRQFYEPAKKCDVIAMGSGVGAGESAKEFMAEILKAFSSHKPVIVDADGLKVVPGAGKLTKNVVLTPHLGEFAALLNMDWRDISSEQAYELAKDYAREKNCVVCLKGATTITTDGEKTYLNRTGNPGMATAGSGDVLTGVVAALTARGIAPLEAAALGAYVHGAAGDAYACVSGETTLTASEIIENLKLIL